MEKKMLSAWQHQCSILLILSFIIVTTNPVNEYVQVLLVVCHHSNDETVDQPYGVQGIRLGIFAAPKPNPNPNYTNQEVMRSCEYPQLPGIA